MNFPDKTVGVKVAFLFVTILEGIGKSAAYRRWMGARELQAHGDDLVLVSDRASLTIAAQLTQPGHTLQGLLRKMRERLWGVCEYRAKGYDEIEDVQSAGLRLLGDEYDHASTHRQPLESHQVITV